MASPPDMAALPQLPRSARREAIDAACRRPEPECVPPLVEAARLDRATAARVEALARRLTEGIRERRTRASGVDALMREFSLSSQEGVALMCLAEALLRVPDRDTADRLIRDKIARGDWRAHLHHSPSPFVNAAAWGLLVTGRLVATRSEHSLGAALTRLIGRGGEPLIRRGMDLAMRMLGEQFVAGRSIGEALERARPCAARGYRYSFDMLGEAAMTAGDAQTYLERYEQAIHAIGAADGAHSVTEANGISVKLSALHPRYHWSQPDRLASELLPRLRQLCLLARDHDMGLNIDAEEADRLEPSLDLLEALVADPALAGWEGLGFVVQAYQKRAAQVVEHLAELARNNRRRLMVRLVKGAYWDSEIKRAQLDGLAGYPVFTRKAYTDVAYLACARRLLAAREHLYPQFATHNAHTLAAVFHLAGEGGGYEFQCLHGMGETLYDQVVGVAGLDRPVRIYAPVGSHETLLAYLVRRLLENGANSSFVNRLVDDRVSVDELIADPVAQAAPLAGAPHPSIPLPEALLGARRNSAGIDLGSEAARRRLAAAIDASREERPRAAPMLARPTLASAPKPVTNPADRSDIVGEVIESSLAAVDSALGAASGAAAEWAATGAEARAATLERAADLLEADAPALIALAVREAGKSWADGVAEVREAVDFCRYYAQQARAGLDGATPLGPVACISPWNFPLAIFTGQLAAALVAGNPVLAKPAGQTPLIAARAVARLHEAGVPRAALQLLPGPGESVGAALIADARVRGVMFTGSTAAARHIARALARRGGDIPLVAETGGQNAMIVDSTALPEQVVADVISSAFDSAGQRCSALRVLCLQEEVYERTLTMLRGAMAELRVGDPADVRTDIGPVIDSGAQAMLEAHIARMRAQGHEVWQTPAPAGCARGSFVPPTLIAIDSLDVLAGEVFGPVLHVLRYRAEALDALVDRINATGYGLTLGVHSRIDETIARVVERARVGNSYVNRNMIGAVVGVQPFGGEGLSGTGPKAGGPLYVARLTRGARPGVPAAAPPERLALEALARWLDGEGGASLDETARRRLHAHIAAYARDSLAGRSLTLPGPTGEENRLSFAPRGRLGARAGSAEARLHQIAAALATGNRLLFDESPGARTLLAALPAALADWVDVVPRAIDAGIAAMMFEGTEQGADALRRELAAREGPIVPLLVPTPDYELTRLVVERSLSINTAAAGGNASLMALGG